MMSESKRVFLDTNFFIYLLESVPQFTNKCEEIHRLYQSTGFRFITSSVSIMEYLVKLYKENDYQKIANFYAFLVDAAIEIIPISADIANIAAQVRSENISIKQMDAIQIAVAITQNCDVFVTNDKRLSNLPYFKTQSIHED